MSKKTGKKGAQYHNDLALKHGAYQSLSGDILDSRTKEARALLEAEAELIDAVGGGGDPSPQELLIIRRASVKAVRCALAEQKILSGNSADDLGTSYLRWAHSMLMDLRILGLRRRKIEKIIKTLPEYLEVKEAEKKEAVNT